MKILLISGCIFIILSLIIAWIASFTKYLKVGWLCSIFKSNANLIRSHIDYLLMSLLLFAFYCINPKLPQTIIWTMVIGAFTNPLLFLVMAIKPDINKSINSTFGIISSVSFLTTTVGFGGAAVFTILYSL